MDRLSLDRKNRLHAWLQNNRHATHEARLHVAIDELAALDRETLLHIAAMSFITTDGMFKIIQEDLPNMRRRVMETCESIVRPDRDRGRKIISSASEGGKIQAAQYRNEWAEYQQTIDQRAAEHPNHSYAQLKQWAAERHGVSEKTISRRTTNPRK